MMTRLRYIENISCAHGHFVHISCTLTNKVNKKLKKIIHNLSILFFSLYKILSSNSS
jgi:hypothetical protein